MMMMRSWWNYKPYFKRAGSNFKDNLYDLQVSNWKPKISLYCQSFSVNYSSRTNLPEKYAHNESSKCAYIDRYSKTRFSHGICDTNLLTVHSTDDIP